MGVGGLVAVVAEEAEKVEEEVDEIEVEAEGAEGGELACGFHRGLKSHLFDLLGVPGGEADE